MFPTRSAQEAEKWQKLEKLNITMNAYDEQNQNWSLFLTELHFGGLERGWRKRREWKRTTGFFMINVRYNV